MANNILAGLHQIRADIQQNGLAHSLSQLRDRIQEISSRLPTLMGLEGLAGLVQSNYLQVRRNLAKKLHGQRKKYKLALESLGWGTLIDLLEAALCGEKLDVLS